MRTDYVPKRITGNNDQKLSSKSIRNIYVGLSAFFHWAAEEFQIPNPMKSVPAPKFTSPEVEPFRRKK
jgi:integrase